MFTFVIAAIHTGHIVSVQVGSTRGSIGGAAHPLLGRSLHSGLLHNALYEECPAEKAQNVIVTIDTELCIGVDIEFGTAAALEDHR